MKLLPLRVFIIESENNNALFNNKGRNVSAKKHMDYYDEADRFFVLLPACVINSKVSRPLK